MSEFLNVKFLDEMSGLRRLGESLSKFQGLLDACSEHLNGTKADFSLLSLSKNSPVNMVLAPKSASPTIEKTMQFIVKTVEQINQGIPPCCPEKLLNSFLIGTRFALGYGEIETETSELFESNLRGFLKKKRREVQTIRGIIEAVDIHEKREFRIFPRLSRPIKCQFEEHQFIEVRNAIGKLAEVSGVAFVLKGDPTPTLLKVESLVVIELRPGPPRSLRGIGAKDYAGVDSVAHVRSVREDFERGFGGG